MSIKFTSIALACLVALSACQTTKAPVIRTSIVFIEPPEALLKCPQISRSQIPDPKTATNRQIVDFINLLYKHNKTCGINMDQIRNYVIQYKKGVK